MDTALAAALAADDTAEDEGMHANSRRTCHSHQCWVEKCADHPMHTDPVGYALHTSTR